MSNRLAVSWKRPAGTPPEGGAGTWLAVQEAILNATG